LIDIILDLNQIIQNGVKIKKKKEKSINQDKLNKRLRRKKTKMIKR